MESQKRYILEIEVEDRMEILIFEALILNLWHDGDTVTFSVLTNAALRQKVDGEKCHAEKCER